MGRVKKYFYISLRATTSTSTNLIVRYLKRVFRFRIFQGRGIVLNYRHGRRLEGGKRGLFGLKLSEVRCLQKVRSNCFNLNDSTDE